MIQKLRTLFRIWDTGRLIRNAGFLIRNDISNYSLILKDDAVFDAVCEFEQMKQEILSLRPSVLSATESLDVLEKTPKSFARFGDGEIHFMQGQDAGFQKYDPLLAKKMFSVLKTKRDDLYVGIGNYFNALKLGASEFGRFFHRKNMSSLRRFLISETNPEITYLHSGCFIGYFGYAGDYDALLERKIKLFANGKVAIVTGRSALDKLDYDIFGQAEDKIIIYAPSKNAFDEYDAILSEINRKVSRDYLVCLILGMTATAMAADLTDMGYMAWDVGHIAKDYDAYMKKTKHTLENVLDFYAPD